jgi:hypothetical protein
MAQRTSVEVRSILLDHGTSVETASVPCNQCKRRIVSLHRDSRGVSNEELATEFRSEGWVFLGYGKWVCPEHVPTVPAAEPEATTAV